MYRIFRAVLVAVPVLMAVAVAIPVLVCDQFRIGGRSMDPVLIAGDHIFVNKLLLPVCQFPCHPATPPFRFIHKQMPP